MQSQFKHLVSRVQAVNIILHMLDSEMSGNNESQPLGLNEIYRPGSSCLESFIGIVS